MTTRFRIAGKESIPTHVESLAMRAPWRAAGWVAGVALLVGGLWLVSTAEGSAAERRGPLAAIAGLAALIAVARFGRAETTVGTMRIECRVGPVRRLVPSGSVAGVERRAARGWRRLYSSEELVVRSELTSRPVVIPVLDAAATIEAIEAVG